MATTSSRSSATPPDSDSKRAVFAWLTLTAFCLPVSIAASSLTLFPFLGCYALAGAWTFRLWPVRWTRLETAFAVFWGISVISALAGMDPFHSRIRLTKDLYVVLVPVLVAILSKETPWGPRLMKAILWGGVVTAAFGLLQIAVGINQSEMTGRGFQHVPAALLNAPRGFLEHLSLNDGRATGLRSHPLTFAETLLFPLAYLLSQLGVRAVHSWRQWGVSLGVLLLALVFSQSRGPWIAFGLMVLTLMVLEPRRRIRLGLGVILALPLVLLLAVPSLRQRAGSIADTHHLSNSERLLMWRAGARMVKDHPWLGVGPGNVRLASPQYQSPEMYQAFGPWGHLHNTYVNLAAERGLLGLGAFLAFIGLLGGRLFRALRTAPDNDGARRTLIMTGLLGGVGWLAGGFTEAVYNDTSVLMLFYCVAGIALAAARPYCRT